jgi:ATP-dependent Lon protease
VPAYLPIEKIKIAQKYLIPRFEKEYGFLALPAPTTSESAPQVSQPADTQQQ